MTEKEIKVLLNQYVEEEMALLEMPDVVDGEEISEKHKRRMKKLFKTEKRFGRRIGLGNFARKAAVFLLFSLIILGVGEVSAHMFGFRPWKYVTSTIPENKMENRAYIKKEKPDDTYNESKAVKEFPAYIPEGLEVNLKFKGKNRSLYMDCYNSDRKKSVMYNSFVPDEGEEFSFDAEYSKKEKCQVAGYEANYYQKENCSWIIWEDQEYVHYISADNIKSPKEELLKMADNIYQE